MLAGHGLGSDIFILCGSVGRMGVSREAARALCVQLVSACLCGSSRRLASLGVLWGSVYGLCVWLLSPGFSHFLPARRHEQDFGPKCRTQLVSYLADAVSDVRMLHTLREDCADDIRK